MTTIEATPAERTPQQQASRWKTIVVCVGAVLLGLVVAPVIFVAIFGLVGLTIALTIAAVVTLADWALLPWAGRVYKTPKFINALSTLCAAVDTKLTEIQETTGSHPKWQEVQPSSENHGTLPWMDLPAPEGAPPALAPAK